MTDNSHSVRLRYGKGLRARFTINAPDEATAKRRERKLREVAEMLMRAGQHAHALEILTAAAGAATDADFGGFVKIAEELCEQSPHMKRAAQARTLTFQDLGERWTSGDLHREYPDQIKIKRTAEHDAGRLEAHVYPVIGGIKVAALTLDDAQEVMRRLPSELTSTTRRHIGHLVVRLMNLAVWPLRIRESSPLPAGFLPQRGPRKALAYLYPDEDRRLLEAVNVPFCYRLLWGFLCREGMREGEAFGLTWGDLDLRRGMVRLDKNKTDDPRAWTLDPGVARALTAYKALLRAEAGSAELVFVDPQGRRHSAFGAAALLRSHLEAIGLKRERPELFESTEHRKQIRVHDLRGTFVTLSLANGQSEAWVSARTGHESSTMLNAYKRTANSFQELDAGVLVPLDFGLPELRGTTAAGGVGHGWASVSRNSEKNGRPQGDSNLL